MRAAWIEIDLEAYRANIGALRRHCGGAGVLAVVKANAYGHGLVPVARAALEGGAEAVAVAIPEEGTELRQAGVAGAVVVLGVWPEEQAEAIVGHGLEAVACTPGRIEALAAAVRRLNPDAPARVHVKVDTGMTRVGCEPEEAVALCRAVVERPELRLAGVLTHFACAEDPEADLTCQQWERFVGVMREVRRVAPPGIRFHAANSAAALWFPPARLDLVRPGIALYGVSPAAKPLPVPLAPVLSLRARLVHLRWVAAGCAVGYGGACVTRRRSLLGLAPLGYADGLPWRLNGKGAALVRGHHAPLLGRLSMDQVVLDLTDVPEATAGEVATLIGADGGERIAVEEVARHARTIPYEVLTGMSARLPRVYRG